MRDRRAQLAAIAADLFRRHGYHNVGVGDIAAAAGITGPAVYRHFPGKRAILGYAVLSGLDALAAAVAATVEAAGPRSDADGLLRTVAATASRLAVERRELGALWRREGRNLPAQDRAALAARARHATKFGVHLVRGVRPALPDADADVLCWAALSVWGSLSDHHVALPKSRFEALLTDLALAVVHSDAVPAGSGDHGSATPVDGSATPVDGSAARVDGSAVRQGPASDEPPHRREQLLSLAARMFQEHGYHGVTMEDIGAAAGITGPSIYRHYAGKPDLLLAMCGRVGQRLRAGVEAALRPGHDPRHALHELVTSFVHTVLEHRDLVAAYLLEGHYLPERERSEVRRLQRRYLAEWVAALRALDPALDDRPARIRVHAAFAVVNDLARTGRFTARPHLAAELTTLALAVLLPASRGPSPVDRAAAPGHPDPG